MSARMVTACNLCAYDGAFTLLARDPAERDYLKTMVGAHAQTATVMCPKCGWTFKPGRLTQAQLAELYSRAGGAATANPDALHMMRERSANVREYIERAAGRRIENSTVLDVGGGLGQVSVAFAASSCRVDMLEMGGGTPVDSSIRLIRSSFDDFRTESTYDLVILSHVLEHTWDPLEWLKRARKLLSPTGLVFVEVPFEFYTPYIKGKLGDPCHVGYFGSRTLMNFMRAAGLKVLALDRTLAPYEARRVMAIRAVGIAQSIPGSLAERVQVRSALLRNISEMLHPYQLMLALLRH